MVPRTQPTWFVYTYVNCCHCCGLVQSFEGRLSTNKGDASRFWFWPAACIQCSEAYVESATSGSHRGGSWVHTHLRDVTATRSSPQYHHKLLLAVRLGMDEILPSPSDFVRFGQKRNADSPQMVTYHAFEPDSKKFPEAHIALPKIATGLVKTTWRSAGPLSH